MNEEKEFRKALRELLNDSSTTVQNGFLMLKANYRAEGRKITAIKLAKAAGYKTYEQGNKQYGSFAHKICELMGIEPKEQRNDVPIWTFAICDESKKKDKRGHLQWILKEDVAIAMEELGIVKASTYSDIFDEIKEKKNEYKGIEEKEKEAIIKSRIGQGVFRETLINHWGGCSVTGHENTDFLIASHIKPWRECNPIEALDMPNGLLLLPNLDKAFDKGYISFHSNGDILLSPQLTKEDCQYLGIISDMKLRWCYPQHEEYLGFHRNNVYKSDK